MVTMESIFNCMILLIGTQNTEIAFNMYDTVSVPECTDTSFGQGFSFSVTVTFSIVAFCCLLFCFLFL
jgi:hypothetical protein